MWPLFCLLFLVHYGMACDRSLGPPGKVKCIMLPRYNHQWQWATCLTDVYIKLRSSHKHKCIDRTTIYCWYQCMLEINEKNNGPVTKECSCSPSQTISPATPLPPECYSPSGESCDWYRNCLERKYPCEPTSNGYAIEYAEKFCRLYGDSQQNFSDIGQKWIDGVRKCLQVYLVPLLRKYSNTTCKQIREKAFESHGICYLKPDKGVPSLSDLECAEYFKIFFIIKGGLNYDTIWLSLKGLWYYYTEPIKTWLIKVGKDIVKILKMIIQRSESRKRRSSDPLPEADARSRFAYRLGSAIASSMSWNKDVMDWLSYPGNVSASNNSNSFDIFIVLADKKGLGIVNNTKEKVDLDNTVRSLAGAIKQGKLPLQVDGYNVWLKSMDSCSDKTCDQAQTLAVSDKAPNWHNGAAKVSKSLLMVSGLTAIAIMLINKR